VLAPRKVALFSLEMSQEQIGARLMAARSNTRYDQVQNWSWNSEAKLRMTNTYGELGDSGLLIYGGAVATVEALVGRATGVGGVDLIIVDHIQLLTTESAYRGQHIQRTQIVTDISRQLKELARTANCPVLALSQLSRNLTLRTDKRPALSDLRDSGALEQDADVVIALHGNEEEMVAGRSVELHVLKHRNGAVGVSRMIARDAYQRFEEPPPIDHKNAPAAVHSNGSSNGTGGHSYARGVKVD